MAMRECVIFDLDGTFAFLGDRSPTMPAKPSTTRSTRPSNSSTRRSARGKPKTAILLVSGREDRWRAETERWLERHGVDVRRTLHAQAGDRRKDTVVKREIYERHIAGKYTVRVVFDDRDQVVRLWRDELDLPCFQVAWGDF